MERKETPTFAALVPGFHVVGKRVKAARRAIGFSRYQLARGAGIAVSSLHELEEGLTGDMHLSTLMSLCLALHCTPDYLLGVSSQPWRQGLIDPQEQKAA